MAPANAEAFFRISNSASPFFIAPLRYFPAASTIFSLSAFLPKTPARKPPAVPIPGPAVALPAAAPINPVTIDSRMFGPCVARLATNQSITPRSGELPMSVNCRSNGEVLRSCSSCAATILPPSSSAPASCNPCPASICNWSTPRPKFLLASRGKLGFLIDDRYCWYAPTSIGSQFPVVGRPVPGPFSNPSACKAESASSASNTVPCTNNLFCVLSNAISGPRGAVGRTGTRGAGANA